MQLFPSGTAREVRELKGEIEGLQWSTDGHSLVYALDGNLWRSDLRGGSPERLWFGQNAVTPAIARKGNRIAYVHRTYSADIWRIALGKSKEAPSRPFPSNLVQQNAQFSPDGKRMVFESTRSGSPEVWVCNMDGSDPLQLTSFGGALTGTPRWSPDGQYIVLDSRATGKPELYIVSSGGGKARMLPTLPAGGSVPYWSHDGNWIYFSSDVDLQPQIFKIPASGGRAVSSPSTVAWCRRKRRTARCITAVRAPGTRCGWLIRTARTNEELRSCRGSLGLPGTWDGAEFITLMRSAEIPRFTFTILRVTRHTLR